MLAAGPNQSGVYTVSINPSIASNVSQPTSLAVPSVSILTQPVQQAPSQRHAQQLIGTNQQVNQVVNISPIRQLAVSQAPSKSHTCSFCQKSFSSR